MEYNDGFYKPKGVHLTFTVKCKKRKVERMENSCSTCKYSIYSTLTKKYFCGVVIGSAVKTKGCSLWVEDSNHSRGE